MNSRRQFLFGLSGLFCAPAVVQAASLMPVSSLASAAVLDPTKIGRVLTDTWRVSHSTDAIVAGLAKGRNEVLSEIVIDIGKGYEAGYIRGQHDKVWRLGFLDETVRNRDLHARPNKTSDAHSNAKEKLLVARSAVSMNNVPLGLTRTRNPHVVPGTTPLMLPIGYNDLGEDIAELNRLTVEADYATHPPDWYKPQIVREEVGDHFTKLHTKEMWCYCPSGSTPETKMDYVRHLGWQAKCQGMI